MLSQCDRGNSRGHSLIRNLLPSSTPCSLSHRCAAGVELLLWKRIYKSIIPNSLVHMSRYSFPVQSSDSIKKFPSSVERKSHEWIPMHAKNAVVSASNHCTLSCLFFLCCIKVCCNANLTILLFVFSSKISRLVPCLMFYVNPLSGWKRCEIYSRMKLYSTSLHCSH